MDDIADVSGVVKKQLDGRWMGSNGVRLTEVQDLSIPRNGQDTFIIPLDRTLGHHDSAQLVINTACYQHSPLP